MKEFLAALIAGVLLLLIEYEGFVKDQNDGSPTSTFQTQSTAAASYPAVQAQFPLPGKYRGELSIDGSSSELRVSSGEYFLNIDDNLDCEIISVLYNQKLKLGRIISSGGSIKISKLGSVALSKIGKRLEIKSEATNNSICQFCFTRYE